MPRKPSISGAVILTRSLILRLSNLGFLDLVIKVEEIEKLLLEKEDSIKAIEQEEVKDLPELPEPNDSEEA